ncbi:hypothetical protein M885DRAFT_513407 [Pelagophyceae sp. CCMP2097]|nr:hypothetical protein M885DRAFT_513407 [Pelagophyceae sp. CCMP2097]
MPTRRTTRGACRRRRAGSGRRCRRTTTTLGASLRRRAGSAPPRRRARLRRRSAAGRPTPTRATTSRLPPRCSGRASPSRGSPNATPSSPPRRRRGRPAAASRATTTCRAAGECAPGGVGLRGVNAPPRGKRDGHPFVSESARGPSFPAGGRRPSRRPPRRRAAPARSRVCEAGRRTLAGTTNAVVSGIRGGRPASMPPCATAGCLWRACRAMHRSRLEGEPRHS